VSAEVAPSQFEADGLEGTCSSRPSTRGAFPVSSSKGLVKRDVVRTARGVSRSACARTEAHGAVRSRRRGDLVAYPLRSRTASVSTVQSWAERISLRPIPLDGSSKVQVVPVEPTARVRRPSSALEVGRVGVVVLNPERLELHEPTLQAVGHPSSSALLASPPLSTDSSSTATSSTSMPTRGARNLRRPHPRRPNDGHVLDRQISPEPRGLLHSSAWQPCEWPEEARRRQGVATFASSKR
jgi:hypothetical protein